MMSKYFTMQGYLPAFSEEVPYHDKLNHIVYGGLAGLGAGFLASRYGLNPYNAALLAASTFAVGKEIWDEKVRNKEFEVNDIIATISLPLLAILIHSALT